MAWYRNITVWVAMLTGALPPLATLASYAISVSLDQVPFCIPPIDGCTSISRAARQEPALFLFRFVMLPQAVLQLACCWLLLQWLQLLTGRRSHAIGIAAFIGAVFIGLYADFLGSQGAVYEWLRRTGIIFYFAGTAMVQLLSVRLLRQAPLPNRLHSPAKWLWRLVAAQWVVGILHVVLKASLSDYDSWENRLEWNLSLLMTSWFLVLAWAFAVSGFQLRGALTSSDSARFERST